VDSAAAPIIDVHELTKSFGEKLVVDRISMKVLPGEIYGFLGPNGSGKTTFMRMLCGLLTPDGGSGTCLGYDLVHEASAIKRSVGYMTQRFSHYTDLSIRENLDFVARIFEVPDRRRTVDEAIERLGLGARQKQLAGELSGGWKQRLALAACMLHRPRLLLLDEPTAGVDPKARRDFWEQIHGLAADGLSVLITTHYMDEAERCHRLAYIAYGRLMTEGTVREVIDQANLVTYRIAGPGARELTERLRASEGVGQVVAFGNALHVSGDEQELLLGVLHRELNAEQTFRPVPATLEDVFISLMKQAEDNYR